MKLVKEIKNKEGTTLFKRWRVLNLWLIYLDVHELFAPPDSPNLEFDKDHFPHNHPRMFISLIREGGYEETLRPHKGAAPRVRYYTQGVFNFVGLRSFHKIGRLLAPYAKTWVLTTRNIKGWGYLDTTNPDLPVVIENALYRARKNAGDYDDHSACEEEVHEKS